MISLTPAADHPELYKALAKDYIKTLRNYDRKIIWSNSAWDQSIGKTTLIEKDSETIGFVTWSFNTTSRGHTMVYIEEFYIAPKFRQKGYGVEAVRVLMQEAGTNYLYLYVLTRNMIAKSFWAKAERELGWCRIIYDEIPEENGCDLRIYKQKPKKQKKEA